MAKAVKLKKTQKQITNRTGAHKSEQSMGNVGFNVVVVINPPINTADPKGQPQVRCPAREANNSRKSSFGRGFSLGSGSIANDEKDAREYDDAAAACAGGGIADCGKDNGNIQ